LVASKVLQNIGLKPDILLFLLGSCSETEVSEQLAILTFVRFLDINKEKRGH
jgi:hypothetical protein